MSQPLPIGVQTSAAPRAARQDVRASIARAAQATGIDFDYLLAQAKLESSLDPTARAGTSSAAGLYQFTNSTWLRTLDRHAAAHGLDQFGAAIQGGQITDPSMRGDIMALRYNADASALMAAELANDNRTDLTAALGREPDAAELYMAHFLGSAGAADFLTALANNPAQSAAAILPKAAAANRRVFFDASGAPRSVAGVMELMRGKVSAAMEGNPPAWSIDTSGAPQFALGQPEPITGGPIARQFHAARQEIAAGNSASGRQSMADTLRTTFAAGDGPSSTPAHVRAAYGQLQRFGL